MAGAVLHGSLGAQVTDTTKKRDTLLVPIKARPDSALTDSLAKIMRARDSVMRSDTVKGPIAHSEMPANLAIARKLYWNRDSLFATGALNVADLVERLPGVTGLHGGWVAAPALGAYLGDVRRIRVFVDGFEYLPLDPRGGGALDLTQINLWAMEEASVEQGPQEIRIYLRTWRVQKTIPETRTDVSTGDQQTNMYRGYYGQRYHSGMVLQFGAQQLSTTPPQILGQGSDQTGVIGRVGWAWPTWSIDGFMTRIGRHRGTIYDVTSPGVFQPDDSLLNVNSSRSDLYLRVGYADPDTSRLWAQFMAVTSKYHYTGIRTAALIANPTTAADSAFNTTSLDTATSRAQYLFTAGTVRGPLRLSATERVIGGGGKAFNIPSVRASFASDLISASAFFEAKSADSSARMDVTAQAMPFSFLSVLGSVGRASDDRVKDSSYTSNYLRGEVGLRVKNLWLLGGVIRRDSVRLPAPVIYNTRRDTVTGLFTPRGELSTTGATIAVRGQLWRLIQADAWAVRWSDTAGLYRPRYQTRSEIYIKTNMLGRFPSGHLGIMASLVHEYRSGTTFPVGDTSSVVDVPQTRTVAVPGYRTISSLLEIRIMSATISWQFRNFLGERYAQVPSLLMPRQTNFYGVRWSFTD